jgi:hypothetical protein
MSRYRRLQIEGGAFFYTLALAERGSDLSGRHIERPPSNSKATSGFEKGPVHGRWREYSFCKPAAMGSGTLLPPGMPALAHAELLLIKYHGASEAVGAKGKSHNPLCV